MTMQAWRTAPPSPIPLTHEPTPQLQHIRDHLRGSVGRLTEDSLDEYMVVVGLLCQPITLDTIAERMGEGWTRRMVETRWLNIADVLCLITAKRMKSGTQDYAIYRLGLARYVYGLTRCWCEF